MYLVRFNNNRYIWRGFWLGRDDSGNIQEGSKNSAERYKSVLAALAAIKEYVDNGGRTDSVDDSWEIVKVGEVAIRPAG